MKAYRLVAAFAYATLAAHLASVNSPVIAQQAGNLSSNTGAQPATPGGPAAQNPALQNTPVSTGANGAVSLDYWPNHWNWFENVYQPYYGRRFATSSGGANATGPNQSGMGVNGIGNNGTGSFSSTNASNPNNSNANGTTTSTGIAGNGSVGNTGPQSGNSRFPDQQNNPFPNQSDFSNNVSGNGVGNSGISANQNNSNGRFQNARSASNGSQAFQAPGNFRNSRAAGGAGATTSSGSIIAGNSGATSHLNGSLGNQPNASGANNSGLNPNAGRNPTGTFQNNGSNSPFGNGGNGLFSGGQSSNSGNGPGTWNGQMGGGRARPYGWW